MGTTAILSKRRVCALLTACFFCSWCSYSCCPIPPNPTLVCRGGTYYRTFTAASYPAVWQLFRHTAPKDLHWYEVIREGRPAHLYFDLEFVPRLNPQVGVPGWGWCGW